MSKHCFEHYVVAGRAVCCMCGLMHLGNLLTAWAIRKGCDYRDDPGWRHARDTLPARHRG